MDHNNLPYKVIRSQRRKTAQITVKATAIEVRVPGWVSDKWVQNWLKDKQDWVAKSWLNAHQHSSAFCLKMKQGASFPYMGKNYRVLWKKNKENRVELLGENLLIELSVRSRIAEQDKATEVLKHWYKEQAFSLFKQRLEYWQKQTGLSSSILKIKAFKRRWGSCSSAGVITLNWKLIMLDISLVDYVIIHELAHLKHMNHGKAFWALVSRYCPQWKARRTALNQRGIILEW